MSNSIKQAALLLLVVLMCVRPALACLNDEDTLASEAAAHPDALRAITGRFDRNPPLYYQMRITRESAEIAANPNDFDKYDDVAVAYDRNGDDDDAIAWIESKRRRLPPYTPNDAVMKEQWYRYYANVGTFWMHRWARRGADRGKIGDVKKARDYIAQAIAIKPDAHFGREKYQLLIMDWVIDPEGETLPQWLQSYPPQEAATALSGLVELGGAWQSFDVYAALSSCLQSDEETTHALGTLAAYRAREILNAGGKSLHHELYPDGEEGSLDLNDLDPSFEIQYKNLRTEADRWQADRTAYMMVRLARGEHPDTDPQFWNDYHPASPPDIVGPRELRRHKLVETENLTLASFLAVALGAGIVAIRRKRKRQASMN